MIRSFTALLIRDLKLAARVGGSGVMGLIFFLMIVTLIPFALGPAARVERGDHGLGLHARGRGAGGDGLTASDV